jgi:uncharacterized protein (DUF1015 family)
MAQIKPFCAVVYNQDKIHNLSHVICPPYDIISPRKQEYYHELDPHNFIHMDLGRDIPGEDKYLRAANYFEQWIKEDVLISDDQPAIYFYSHQYWVNREKKIRLGFLALLKLEERKSSVFGHEHTRLEPKEDRLKLIRQVKANLSPIFVVFADKKRLINQIWNHHVQNVKPFIDITDEDSNVHKVWRITDPKYLEKVSAQMETESMFIADGHHRYEVSCTYRDEMKKKNGGSTGEEDFNYTLTYFTNIDPVGLTILPIHRLVKLEKPLDLDKFAIEMGEHFHVDELKDRQKFFFMLEKAGVAEHAIGIYYNKRYLLLRLKNVKVVDKLITDKPQEYRRLDVSILNTLVLNPLLRADLVENKSVSFVPEKDELLAAVEADNLHIAFFLNPTKIEQIVSVALAGEKMPPKSTYFFPKPVSGLLINKHHD